MGKHRKRHYANQQAFGLSEFAAIMGHHRSWAYRQRDEGRIRTIRGYGKELVPASELERILEGGAE